MSDIDAVATGDTGVSSEPAAELDTSTTAESTTETSFEQTPESTEPPEGALFQVDGEWITLEEAEKGYLRQADYTRKTQATAAERKQVEQMAALASALEHNPTATLQALAETYGVQFGQPTAADLEAMDPYERQTAELESRLAEIERREALAAVDREVATLQAAHPDVDADAVMAFAVTRNLPDLETAYRVMYFDQMSSAQQAAQSDQVRTEAKRAAQVVSSESSIGNTAPAPKKREFANFREAALAAAAEKGIDLGDY